MHNPLAFLKVTAPPTRYLAWLRRDVRLTLYATGAQ